MTHLVKTPIVLKETGPSVLCQILNELFGTMYSEPL